MSGRIAGKATLVNVPAASGEPPTLRGSRCRCGHTSFPPQLLGCHVCGAGGTDVTSVALAASGTLRSFAMVHRQKRPGGDSPLIVGALLLDDGPLVEVVIDAVDTTGLAVGRRMLGRLVTLETNAEGQAIVDCQFAPAAGE
jgi:uncharacterized OB-fold protein